MLRRERNRSDKMNTVGSLFSGIGGLDSYIRIERTKAVGNAVVPQVAQVIGEMILEFEKVKI
jgi:site-specific DNA-cytosine methylase